MYTSRNYDFELFFGCFCDSCSSGIQDVIFESAELENKSVNVDSAAIV